MCCIVLSCTFHTQLQSLRTIGVIVGLVYISTILYYLVKFIFLVPNIFLFFLHRGLHVEVVPASRQNFSPWHHYLHNLVWFFARITPPARFYFTGLITTLPSFSPSTSLKPWLLSHYGQYAMQSNPENIYNIKTDIPHLYGSYYILNWFVNILWCFFLQE